jgi:hypothetical protein
MDTIQDGVEHMNINNLVHKYYLSNDFNVLADKTKHDYQYCAGVLLATEVDGKSLSEIRLTKMTGAIARSMSNGLVEESIRLMLSHL